MSRNYTDEDIFQIGFQIGSIERITMGLAQKVSEENKKEVEEYEVEEYCALVQSHLNDLSKIIGDYGNVK